MNYPTEKPKSSKDAENEGEWDLKTLKILHEEAVFQLRDTLNRASQFRRESWWLGFTAFSVSGLALNFLAGDTPGGTAKYAALLATLALFGAALVLIGMTSRISLYIGLNWEDRFTMAQSQPVEKYYASILGKIGKGEGIFRIIEENRNTLRKKEVLRALLMWIAGTAMLTIAASLGIAVW